MVFSRREMGKMALAAGSAGLLRAKPNSNFGGVQIGVITYSFRTLPGSAEQTLQYCRDCGISAIEMMSNVAEGYAGAPAMPGRPGRGQMTAETKAAMQKAAEDVKKWRLSVSMDKFKALRRMYADAGVKTYAFKLPPTMAMSDAEYEYIWNVAETVGANHITMELPTDDALLQRVAEYAAKRKLRIAFHTHGQGGSSGFDKALGASPYTALNLDVGHYFGVTGESPVPIIEKYHDRIASLHLKDRKAPGPNGGGANVPWGQGGTPLKEILQTMKKKKFKFPGSIEYEYNTPEGSSVVAEVKKCVDYCQAALA
ncbi:MAG: sugar phosphate isomerase/epimerase [Bryobacterales bacterium]|nr:sugar phosphate isomerase/epimerase [Bryobacterales bacterium]